jgi:cyclopropane-fatty-acyl-phospholipid synthase
LRRWRRRFLANWPAIRAEGFDETFRRMWEFYLAYSEAGFASGYLDVGQLRLTRR